MIRVVDHSDEFLRDLLAANHAGLRSATLIAAESAAASMPGAGAGVSGTRRGRNSYRASNPGSPPGVRTARLKNSITNAPLAPGAWGYGTNVFYGRILENGTKRSGLFGGRRIRKRPFLKPVLVREKSSMRSAYVHAASREMARRATRG